MIQILSAVVGLLWSARSVVAFLQLAAVFLTFAFFIVVGLESVPFFHDWLVSPVSAIQSLFSANSSVGNTASQLLGVGNTLFPISEALQLFTAFGIYYVACSSVRMVKAWIPTLS